MIHQRELIHSEKGKFKKFFLIGIILKNWGNTGQKVNCSTYGVAKYKIFQQNFYEKIIQKIFPFLYPQNHVLVKTIVLISWDYSLKF